MTPLLWMQYAYDAGTVIRLLLSVDNDNDTGTTSQDDMKIQEKSTRLGILDLGIKEFPGCAFLQSMYFDTFCDLSLLKIKNIISENESSKKSNLVQDVEAFSKKVEDEMTITSMGFDSALSNIGRGSHCTDDVHVVKLYRIYIQFLVSIRHFFVSSNGDLTMKKVIENCNLRIFDAFQRRARTPMKKGNDSIMDEWNDCAKECRFNEIPSSTHIQDCTIGIEEGKRFASKYFGILLQLEEDVEASMSLEGISWSSFYRDFEEVDAYKQEQNDLSICSNSPDWGKLLCPITPSLELCTNDNISTNRYLMGFGMTISANSFCKYARTLFNYKRNETKRIQHKNKESRREADSMEPDDYTNTYEDEHEEVLKTITSLTIPVYERAISECPTVELIWEKYIRHLIYLLEELNRPSSTPNDHTLSSKPSKQDVMSQLKHVCDRSVRNCPYSVNLFCLKMTALMKEVQYGLRMFEPDDLCDIVSEAIKAKFLPSREASLQLYMTANNFVKTRVLDLISAGTSSKSFDSIEKIDDCSNGKKKRKRKDDDLENSQDQNIACIIRYGKPLNQNLQQDIIDLIEDLREMYDTTDIFLRKEYNDWTEGRAILFTERAHVEAYILCPLCQSFREIGDHIVNGDEMNSVSINGVKGLHHDNGITYFEKLVRVHQPPHPNSWRSFISYMMGKRFPSYRYAPTVGDCGNFKLTTTTLGVEAPGMVVAKTRFVRSLYRRAMDSVKRNRKLVNGALNEQANKVYYENSGLEQNSYGLSLQFLCIEFLDFEKRFGSDDSLSIATKIVHNKLALIAITSVGSIDHKPLVINDTHIDDRIPTQETDKNLLKEDNTKKCSDVDGEEKIYQAELAGSYRRNDDTSLNLGIEGQESLNPNTCENSLNHESSATLKSNTVDLISAEKLEEKKPECKKMNLKVPKLHPEHKVKIGKLEYPAHPFTIHVSNLSYNTEDMDLVDLFQQKCGAIVHARILREKNMNGAVKNNKKATHLMKGKSKGVALVQFEERESVDKAINLDGILGLNEKLLKVSRSHQPGVAVVPPGMHRVKAYGKGKNSKRNQQRKDRRPQDSEISMIEVEENKTSELVDTSVSSNTHSSVLAFRPSSIHRKKRISN
eukprot:CAMPEP_0184868488 /NCGR_PEP_ID=MMETSP0580-20130426/30596_1 /TAXON_ID=1118495 /ORGANISM="Dactyliosolen fragilissimus" /LENGTH=1112 /DNA_ID=CAMNT_0027369415 /DNA_START=252 /DNA_END=3590 /DNA_ORIENTATION=+